jgi:hypothetical protein
MSSGNARQRLGRFALGLACAGLAGFAIFLVVPNVFPYDASLPRAFGESVILTLLYLTPLTLITGLILLRRWRSLLGSVAILLLLVVATVLWPGAGDPVASNDSSAVANLRVINTAEITHLSSDGRYVNLPALIAAGLLDSRYSGTKVGYRFNISVSDDGKAYTATATPLSKEAGRFGYRTTEDQVIRYATSNSDACSPCFPENQAGAPVQ